MNVLKATDCEKYTPAKKKQFYFYSKWKKYIWKEINTINMSDS